MASRAAEVEGQLGMFEPRTEWSRHDGPLPRLRDMDVAIDTEERDDGLGEGLGPGWVYNKGYILGVSVAWDGGSIYVPVRHPDTENRPIEEVIDWVESILRTCRCHFFNMGFDMGWLIAEGCKVWPERAHDGQVMASMLDENWDTYNLDACCARAGVPGKDEEQLNEALAWSGVAKRNGSLKHGMWRLPARHVGPYAEQDAIATLRLCRTLLPILQDEEQLGAYQTEMDLIPVIHDMRRRGIRVSRKNTIAAKLRVEKMAQEALAQVPTPPAWRRSAVIDDLRSPKKLADIFDAEGIQYSRTAKTGQPSFTKKFLEGLTNPVGRLIRRTRQLHDLSEKFLDAYILGFEHVGRIHAEIHALRGDDGGAKTTRLSYSNPPLQQMPSRDPELAPIVRSVFLPEEGEFWGAPDYSQQEPRLYVHYSYHSIKHARRLGIAMDGVEDAVAYYRDSEKPDFHQMMADMTNLPRRTAKDINLGVFYRMGAEKFSRETGIPLEQAQALFEQYHARAPWIRGLAQYAESRANTTGYVRMIDGARRHYPFWQPRRSRVEGEYAREEEARRRWPGTPLSRAFTYQAGNSVVQGSAARQTKKAMVECHRAGHLPLVQMHDELDFSFANERAALEVEEIMRNVVKLVVPVKVDLEFGTTWGNAKYNWAEATKL